MIELDWCVEYTKTMFKALRSEEPDEAFGYIRQLQQLEEIADRDGKTVLLKAELVNQ